MDQQILNVMSIYSPENCKPTDAREKLYEEVQTIHEITHEKPVILMGDFNARIGKELFPGVKQRFNAENINANGANS